MNVTLIITDSREPVPDEVESHFDGKSNVSLQFV